MFRKIVFSYFGYKIEIGLPLYKNKAIGTSLLYLSDNTAGIYHVATLPNIEIRVY